MHGELRAGSNGAVRSQAEQATEAGKMEKIKK